MHVNHPQDAGAAGTGTATAPSSRLLPLVITLFFAWGFCTVLVDVLVPKLKATFSLNYAEAMLTQFCFFLAYFVVSIPAGLLVSRIGYLRGIVLGLQPGGDPEPLRPGDEIAYTQPAIDLIQLVGKYMFGGGAGAGAPPPPPPPPQDEATPSPSEAMQP